MAGVRLHVSNVALEPPWWGLVGARKGRFFVYPSPDAWARSTKENPCDHAVATIKTYLAAARLVANPVHEHRR